MTRDGTVRAADVRDSPAFAWRGVSSALLPPAEAQAEFIGVALFSPRGVKIVRDSYHRLSKLSNAHPFHEAARFAQARLSDLVQELLDQGLPVTAVDIYKGWMEVDTYEDYVKVCEQVRL